MNLIDCRIAADRIHVGADASAPLAQHLKGLAPGAYRLGIRPHRLSTDSPQARALTLGGVVEFVELSGSETFLHVRLTASGAHCVIHQAGTHPHSPGEALDVSFDPTAMYAYSPDGRLAAAPGA